MPDLSVLTSPAPYHILSYGLLLGTEVFHSFVGGIVSYRCLPRPSFATLQSNLFPVYFSLQTALPAVLALTFPGGSSIGAKMQTGLSGILHESNRWSALLPIGAVFLAGLSNLAYIGPETTRVMKIRKHQETRDGKKYFDPGPHSSQMQELNKRFGILHGISSVINLGAVISTIWYGFVLADHLR